MKQNKTLLQKTAGQRILENFQVATDGKIPVMDLSAAMLQDYMPKLLATIDEQCRYTKESFYIEVLQKQERLLPNTFRPHVMICHTTCPRPYPDQTIFRYNQNAGRVELIWVLPPEDVIVHLIENYKYVDKDERELLEFCVMYARGDLWNLMKKFNGESADSPLLINEAITI